jgi:hypothetical protein
MLTTVVLAVATAGIALLRRGSLERLAYTKFRWPWLLWSGLALQVVAQVWSPSWLTEAGELVVLLGTYSLVAGFLGLNFRLPGIALAALGLVLNVVVIGANGAMPVDADAADSAGIERSLDEAGLKHERMTTHTTLPWLGDVLPMRVLEEVLSLGDILLALGLAYLIHARMMQRPGRHSFRID